jgi:hypothetical protein
VPLSLATCQRSPLQHYRNPLAGISRATNQPHPSPGPCVVSKFDPMGMNGSVIVWDLETVPDIGGFAAANASSSSSSTIKYCPLATS